VSAPAYRLILIPYRLNPLIPLSAAYLVCGTSQNATSQNAEKISRLGFPALLKAAAAEGRPAYQNSAVHAHGVTTYINLIKDSRRLRWLWKDVLQMASCTLHQYFYIILLSCESALIPLTLYTASIFVHFPVIL
jgi:hypothetical protein